LIELVHEVIGENVEELLCEVTVPDSDDVDDSDVVVG
jgi:hypothetical protein